MKTCIYCKAETGLVDNLETWACGACGKINYNEKLVQVDPVSDDDFNEMIKEEVPDYETFYDEENKE